MRETDISKFTKKRKDDLAHENGAKRCFKALGRTLFTILMVLVFAGTIVAISLSIYVAKIASEPTGVNLKANPLTRQALSTLRTRRVNTRNINPSILPKTEYGSILTTYPRI